MSTIFLRPKVQAIAEALEEHYKLPAISGDISGTYQFYYTPYFLGVAAMMDDPDVHEIDLMKASQIGWTYFLIGCIFKRIKDASVGRQLPIMMLFAKAADGKSFHDEKLVEAGQANIEWLEGLVDFSTSRKAGNRWDFKTFTNGFLKLVGSNSPGNVKSTSSVGLAIVEEPDDTSDDVKGQGDSISNLEERLKRYMNSLMIVGGTPAIKGLSKTQYRVEASDARVLPIACHECGEKHILDFNNVVWDGKDAPDNVDKNTGEVFSIKHEIYGYSQPATARYVCPKCQAEWDDYQRQENIRNTVYDAIKAGDKNCGWVATKPFFGKAGFMELGEIYACIPGTSLADVVLEYLEAEHLFDRGDDSKKIKFVNQKEGRPYEYKSDAPDEDVLRERCEDYKEMVVPVGGYRLTAGVDLQHDRIAIKIKAWGKGEESWLIYAGEIYGNVIDKADPVWKELDEYLYKSIKHDQGFSLKIEAASLDTSDGTTSDAAYHYVRMRKHKGMMLMAIKGSSSDYGSKEIFSKPKQIDTKGKNNTKAAKYGLLIYSVGTHKAKDLISSRMSLEGVSGVGRMHWYEGVRDDYFKQMLGEVKAPGRNGKKTWQAKSGQPHEFWDCEVYATHAARALKIHIMSDIQWDALATRLMQADMFADRKVTKSTNQKQTEQNKNGKSGSGWVDTGDGDWIS